MQAITVLLLELTQGKSHLSEDTSHVTACMEKLVQWLATMKPVDAVAGNAHTIVCDMLSKHEQFARKISPGSWLLQTLQPSTHAQSTFANISQSHSTTDPRLTGESTYPPMPFSDDLYTGGNERTFDLNTLSDPLDDPYGAIQFGQAQYPLFYGNQFTTLYDQEMSYQFDDSANMEEGNAMGQGQDQGQGQQPPR
jgi:hypothetical protein